MKKLINTAGVYGALALASGVFNREFVKWNGFKGESVLSVAHTHFFAMGTFLFLFISLFALNSQLLDDLKFQRFNQIYQFAFPGMMLTMYARGILQVLETDLSKGLEASIAGVAGLSHILVTVALVYLFLALKNVAVSKDSI